MSVCIGTFSTHSAVRGYHVYQGIWSPQFGEVLTTEPNPFNSYDTCAVSVKQGHIIVGHIPKEQSKICSFFLKRGGQIQVEVFDIHRRRSRIPEGGLEIPAVLHFFGNEKDIAKLPSIIQEL